MPSQARTARRRQLITGASDDDPSGIATYSQAGAQFGYRLGWSLVFAYPMMVVTQAISARIGRTTGRGIAGNLREHYPNWLLQRVVFLLFVANTLNLGADLGAMGEASRLLLPAVATWVYVILFGVICTAAQIVFKHTRYGRGHFGNDDQPVFIFLAGGPRGGGHEGCASP